MIFRRLGIFIRGLNDDYKTKVKTQYPKTLEEAIKAAQIYDDSADKLNKPTIWGKSSSSNTFSNNVKRKNGGSSKEDTNKGNGKNPKGAGGPLTSDKLARARKERLCFQCLGSHERKDCPKLKSNELKNKNKEKSMHMVQLLSLGDCPKYSTVQVCHQSVEHECCLTGSSMAVIIWAT